MQGYQQYLSDYQQYMLLKNYSKATLSAYSCALRQFFKWHKKQQSGYVFHTTHVRSYLALRYEQGLKWQTVNGDYSALLIFYQSVLRQAWEVEHLPRPRKERTLPKVLSQEVVQKLIEHGQTYKHQVYMSLLYATGLRLSESLNLQLHHIDGKRRQILVACGKGAKDRYVDLPEQTLLLLRSYYRAYRPVSFLFYGTVTTQAWATRSAQHALQQAARKAKIIQKVSPHILRHCYATHHLENGTNLVYLKQQMGHANLKTTARYIQVCQNYRQKVQHPVQNMDIQYQPHRR
ncbi:MAG: tyrosine-type recombinase/integrase [Bacteroidota bacterium]